MKKMHPQLIPLFGVLAYLRQLGAANEPAPHSPFFSCTGNFSGNQNIFFMGNPEGGMIFSFTGNFSFIGIFSEKSFFSFLGTFSGGTHFSFTGNFSEGSKSYELVNHLGNVCVVVSDRKLAVPTTQGGTTFDHWKAEVLSAQDYYPFGMLMPGRSFFAEKYRWGFGGKEKLEEWDNKTGVYDFDARMLNVLIGRWMSRDPLADKYPDYSPYSFVNNMPIWAKDPNGKDIIILSAPKGASGFGHTAVLIGNEKDGWRLYSKNGTTAGIGSSGPSNKAPDVGVPFKTLKEFVNSESNFTQEGEIKYEAAFRITTDKQTDEKMKVAAKESVGSYYNVACNSCIDVVSDALEAGELDPGYKKEILPSGPTIIENLDPVPNERYKQIVKNNQGTDISGDIAPDKEVATQRKQVADKVKENKLSAKKKETQERIDKIDIKR